MLRNIPANLSPDLVKILLEMGHGDEILLADANFPGHHLHPNTVRADGLGIPDLLTSILTLMPLDRYSSYQVALMETVGDDPRPHRGDRPVRQPHPQEGGAVSIEDAYTEPLTLIRRSTYLQRSRNHDVHHHVHR